jgi:uncharacterized protein YqjF (DUF2071 family)
MEPITNQPPRHVRLPSMRHHWSQVAFIHWAVDPAVIAPLLPRHVRPDLVGETTYLGLIGLRIYVLLGGRVPVPRLGVFNETHLRVYSVDRHGRRGAVFLVLNADRLVTSAFARFVLRVPYTWSPSEITHAGAVATYTTTRRWPAGPDRLRFGVRIGDPIPEAAGVDQFVTARGACTRWLGKTVRVDVDHPPWPLYAAGLADLDLPAQFLAEARLPVRLGDPVSVLWSPGVTTAVGFPAPA